MRFGESLEVVASPSVVDPEATYRRQTPGSRALHDRAVGVMPGGTTRTTTYFDPYPLYIDRGEGCRIWDVDGTERLDMLGNYTAMILGHAHPKVVEAVRKQVARGTAFASVYRAAQDRAHRRRISRHSRLRGGEHTPRLGRCRATRRADRLARLDRYARLGARTNRRAALQQRGRGRSHHPA